LTAVLLCGWMEVMTWGLVERLVKNDSGVSSRLSTMIEQFN
jgi:hypothetical protein